MTFQEAATTAITGAVIGALIGATLTFWLQRARPQAILYSQSFRPDYPDPEGSVQPNPELMNYVQKWYEWSALSRIPPVPTETEYVRALMETRDQVKRSITSYEHLGLCLKDFQNHVDGGRLENARVIFADIDEGVFHALAGHLIYGGGQLTTILELGKPSLQPDEGIQIFKGEKPNPRLTVVRTTPGPRSISFSISKSWAPNHWDNLEVLAVGLCRLLWSDNKTGLSKMATYAGSLVSEQRDVCSKLELAITSALIPFEKIVVEGIITNSGARALSALPRCKLFIQLKGHPVVTEKREAGQIENDVDVWLRFTGTWQEQPVAGAEAIAPGSSFTFLAVSESKIADLPNSDALRKAFDGANVKSYLALALVGLRKDVSIIYSRPSVFRDIENRQDIPPKKG
ncbi:hypothetical protein [Arthrobacter sp. K5]|uniref:Uncharacterized protein n=1 Tax=Arthrobacter sp. K5 TaxID=2839623 RepID=A0AAU8EKA2_9MICC